MRSDAFADEKRLNIFVLGKQGVGKTSFLKNLLNKEFPSEYLPTIGIDYFVTNTQVLFNLGTRETENSSETEPDLALSSQLNNSDDSELNNSFADKKTNAFNSSITISKHAKIKYRLHFWDFSGDEIHQGIVNKYYLKADSIFIIIDDLSPTTKLQLKGLTADINSQCRLNTPILLILNKKEKSEALEREGEITKMAGDAGVKRFSVIDIKDREKLLLLLRKFLEKSFNFPSEEKE